MKAGLYRCWRGLVRAEAKSYWAAMSVRAFSEDVTLAFASRKLVLLLVSFLSMLTL